MRSPRKALRTKIAAHAITATISSFVVVPLVLLTGPALAQTLRDAEAALDAGRQELLYAVYEKQNADFNVSSALSGLDTARINFELAEQNYEDSAATSTTYTEGTLQVSAWYRPGVNNAPEFPTEEPAYAGTSSQINYNWGGGDIFNLASEDVTVRWTGSLTFPTTGEYCLHAPADDGVVINIDRVSVLWDWFDKGGGGSTYCNFQEAGVEHDFELWYYENGGGAHIVFYWWTPTMGYQVVPATAFGVAETTTTYSQELFSVLETQNMIYILASEQYETALQAQSTAQLRLTAAENAIPILEKAVVDATPLEKPKVQPTPTPTSNPEPTAEPTPEVTAVPESTPPTSEEIVEELWAEATKDDIVVSEELAAIPVLGSAIVALADAINFVGNVGADMTPEVREQSEKIVVSAIIVTQVATQAVVAASIASSSGSTSSGRREQ